MGILFLDYQFKNAISNQVQTIADSTKKLFYLKIDEEQKVLELVLDEIVSHEGLAEAISQSDYKKIDFIISPHYKHLKAINTNVKILTFRSSEGVTLYRAHKPSFYGDTLNKKRKLIVDTNTMQRSFSGFEVGKLEMTYRTTQAVFL